MCTLFMSLMAWKKQKQNESEKASLPETKGLVEEFQLSIQTK